MEQRTETDFLGSRAVPADALYGIHAVRARENFPDQTPFHEEWYRAMGIVKQACYITASDYFMALKDKFGDKQLPVRAVPDKILGCPD